MLRLWYVVFDEKPVDVSIKETQQSWALDWTYHMVEANPDTIFFYTIDSTDI